MTAEIPQFNGILHKVESICKRLGVDRYEHKKGRKLAIGVPEIIALAVFKQANGIPTKKALHDIFEPNCTYKTLVVNLNRFASLALLIVQILLASARKRITHLIKHTDSTEIPVCTDRKARSHKTMQFFARWGKTGKGWFYGLKMHITSDLSRSLLSVKFTSGNVDDRSVFEKLNHDLTGIFVADAGYVSRELERRFSNGKRIILAIPKINMRKIATDWQIACLNTRMAVELNFRNLKLFHGLITSFPRSVNGYLANYIYSLLAYQIA